MVLFGSGKSHYQELGLSLPKQIWRPSELLLALFRMVDQISLDFLHIKPNDTLSINSNNAL